MARRAVVQTDDGLTNGRPLPRAYIAQVDDQFAQFYANLIGSLDNIINSPEIPAAVKIQAAKEMRFQIKEQMILLKDIEARQDQIELESRSSSMRELVISNPIKALALVEAEIKKLAEFKKFVENLCMKKIDFVNPTVINNNPF